MNKHSRVMSDVTFGAQWVENVLGNIPARPKTFGCWALTSTLYQLVLVSMITEPRREYTRDGSLSVRE